MEPENFMKKSPGPSENKFRVTPADLEMEFPVDPNFISRTPTMTVDEVVKFTEELYSHKFNSKEEAERRLREKCDVEFKM